MSEAAQTLRPGDVIAGRYRIERVLGEGGMGVVYEATQINLVRAVALKILLPEYWHRTDARRRFQREAKVAAALAHSSAVTIYDFGEDQERLFIAMELLRGVTLRSLLSSEAGGHRLELLRTVDIAAQIASVLVAAHQMALVHRDLKPENIFLEPTEHGGERIVVVDFGLAFIPNRQQDMGRLTREGILSGTPTYISPEQVRSKEVGPKADVYSLGCMFYEMVTGVVPFRGDDDFELIAKHVYTPPTPARDAFPELDIPPSLDGLILEMLAKDPERRPAPEQVIDRLSGVAADLRARERGRDARHLLDRSARMVPEHRDATTATTLTDVEVGTVRSKPLAVIGALEEPIKLALSSNGLRVVEGTASSLPAGAVAFFAPGASLELLAQLARSGLPVLTDADSSDIGRIAELLAVGIDDVVPLPLRGDELARKVWRAIKKSKRAEHRER